MVDPFTSDTFYTSAREFALCALESHYAGNHRRVPLFAGTAVEHLAKACLAKRSPALLLDLRRDSSFSWLVALLRVEGAGAAAGIRTVGLSEALNRMRRFVRSAASKDDLQILTDMRNGVVHAAEDAEVEERILTAFVQQADSLLEDLGRERRDFWGGQLAVVDALLADASNKVKHRVRVRLAAAEALIDRRYEAEGEAVIAALRALSRSAPLTADQRFRDCPVCGSDGMATGEHTAEVLEGDPDGETGWFTAQKFRCPVCNLRLESEAEIDAAGIDSNWHIEDAAWRDYQEQRIAQRLMDDPPDDYERWREQWGGL
jgi:hypothetical protein